MDEPIFICGLGAQKAGTTWLSRYLEHHPQVYAPYVKEMHFFDYLDAGDNINIRVVNDLKRRASKAKRQLSDRQPRQLRHTFREVLDIAARYRIGTDADRYLRFMQRGARGLPAFADITPAYAIVSSAMMRQMYDLAPHTRFVFIMRNPAERYWSGLTFAAQTGANLNPHANFYDHLTTPSHMWRTRYDVTLANLEAAGIPSQHIAILFFETLFHPSGSGATEIERMCHIVGIDYIPPRRKRFGRYKGNKLTDDPMRSAAVRAFRPVYEDIYARFGEQTPSSWRQDMTDYL